LTLLNDILVWATSDLTSWQRDAIRRLFQKQNLDTQDFDDLYALLKSAHGLPDPQDRKPIPLAQEHLPAQAVNSDPVVLRGMRDLKHVNRISSGQELKFVPQGITVIYGGNGSGKSGYSRVLKRACRARDLVETVHPDAFDTKVSGNIPEAVFDVEIGGKASSVSWSRDAVSPVELATVAVFDARCARNYLNEEGNVAYLPYGLDIVENLGQKVLPEMAKRLEAEIASISTDTTAFADLLGATQVGSAIAALSASSDAQKVRELGTLSAAETSRVDALDQALMENDPKAKAIALRLSARRVDGLILRIDTAVALVDAIATAKLQSLDDEARTASATETAAAAGFRNKEPLLAGTGEAVWKSLFEAARRFSVEKAYPEKSFPNVDSDSKCPLCQQSLAGEGGERLQRFADYIKQDASRLAGEKRELRDKGIRGLTAASVAFGLDVALAEELKQLSDPMFAQSAMDFEQKVGARKAWILGAAEAHVWNGGPAFDGDPRSGLRDLSARLASQAAALDGAGDEKQRSALESERAELKVRASLSVRLQSVLDVIQRMQTKQMLSACGNELKTKVISDKTKEFASRAVTTALKNALNTEFEALGVGHIKTKLNERVEKGKMKHKLVLDLPVTRKLDEILSEGEQRAIAIGSFLAELHLANHRGGIVFDDPVSSLDHDRRKAVARRLVDEVKDKKRQVVILTHDTTFLGELRDVIEQQNVDHLICHLEWAGDRPGIVSDGLPWEHKSYKDRLDMHEKMQRVLEKSWSAHPNEEDRNKMRHEYGRLRATLERIIQDVVFGGVVRRYRDWIRVDKLSAVVGFAEAEANEMARLHKAYSDVADAHDPSSAKNAPVPDAKQLGRDIAALKAVTETIQAGRKKSAAAAIPAP